MVFLILCSNFVPKLLIMTAEEKILTTFSTRVRQLLLRFDEIKKENDRCHTLLEEKERTIKQLEEQLAQKQQDYSNLMTAKMLEIGNDDMETAKAKLAKLIRSVNKCITLLSENNVRN